MRTTNQLTAIILAAGTGTRLRPLTDSRPKTLVPACGVPLLGYILEPMARAGVTDALIVTGYLEDAIKAYVPTLGLPFPVRYLTNEVYATTNNIHSLWIAREGVDNDALLLDADLVWTPAALDALLATAAPVSIAANRRDIGEVRFTLGPQGFVRTIGKHVPLEGAYGESIGMHYFARDALRALFGKVDAFVREGRSDIFYEMAFERMIADEGWQFDPVDVTDAGCVEVDCVEDLRRLEQVLVASGRAPRAAGE